MKCIDSKIPRQKSIHRRTCVHALSRNMSHCHALGRRVSTTTLEGTIRHVYDGVQCIADVDADGDVVVSYTWGAGIDNLLATRIGGETYYPLTDIQGTVWGYVDSATNIVARFEYDAWGNILSAISSVSALARNRYRFQCREWSAATGLINFRARWYDPATGRWLSKDPIGLSGGLNLYAFCGDDLMNYRDPFGRIPFFIYPNPPGWHKEGRDAKNNPLPSSVEKIKDEDGWTEAEPWQNAFHDNGNGKPERKFINDDGREAVYDGDTGKLITNPDLKGTYNYVNPAGKNAGFGETVLKGAGHIVADVIPFLIWGN